MNRHPFLALLAGTLLAAAPSTTPADDLRGFTSESARAERDWEKKFASVPSPDSLRSYMRRLSARPHHVGSPYDQDNAEWILARFKSFGLTRVERRDPAKTDHPMTSAQLTVLTSSIAWPRYFRAIGLRVPVTKVNVGEPAFVQRVDSLIRTAPLATWRAYLTYHAIAPAAPWLASPFAQENFAWQSRFSGARAMLPRWQRCLRETDGDLG